MGVMTKQDIIREGVSDFIVRLAKSDETDACESCEKLELKPVCSIRHNADEYLIYLHSKDVVIKANCHACDGDGRADKHFVRQFSNRCPECNGYGFKGVEPLVEK